MDECNAVREVKKAKVPILFIHGSADTVMHRPEDNGLDLSFEHQIKAVSREQLEFMYYYLCRIMFKGTENPNLPIGDIIKLV